MRQIYVCCPNEKRVMYEEIAKEKYKDMKICKDLLMADVMVIVGHPQTWTEQMCQEIEWGKMIQIDQEYVNEKMVNKEIYETLLSTTKRISLLNREKIHAYERER